MKRLKSVYGYREVRTKTITGQLQIVAGQLAKTRWIFGSITSASWMLDSPLFMKKAAAALPGMTLAPIGLAMAQTRS